MWRNTNLCLLVRCFVSVSVRVFRSISLYTHNDGEDDARTKQKLSKTTADLLADAFD